MRSEPMFGRILGMSAVLLLLGGLLLGAVLGWWPLVLVSYVKLRP